MHSVAIIVVLKVFQLSLKIPGIPEHEVIKEFPAYGRMVKKLMRLLGCSISASRPAFPESESGWFPRFFD